MLIKSTNSQKAITTLDKDNPYGNIKNQNKKIEKYFEFNFFQLTYKLIKQSEK